MADESVGKVGFSRGDPPRKLGQLCCEFKGIFYMRTLVEHVGSQAALIIWRHLAKTDVDDKNDSVICHSIGEARKKFSAKTASDGLRLFAPEKGGGGAGPLVMMSLDNLMDMLAKARKRPSLVDALAASEDLPVAPHLTAPSGTKSPLPSLERLGSNVAADW